MGTIKEKRKLEVHVLHSRVSEMERAREKQCVCVSEREREVGGEGGKEVGREFSLVLRSAFFFPHFFF